MSWIEGKLNFVSLGKSYNHVSGMPLHENPKTRCRSRVQIYNGDEIRLGGNVDGETGGGFSDFIFLVNAPALGDRPHASGGRAPRPVPVASQPAPAPHNPPPSFVPRPAAAAPLRASANEAEAERKRRREFDRKQQERVA